MSDSQESQTKPGLERAGALIARYADWVLGLGVLGLMVTLITPLPPAALDILLALNLTISLLLLLVTMNVKGSAELSTFPTILLFVTLFRLGLNVASTRLILTSGEAGSIIAAFGSFVVGDNLTVGLIVFLILIIIQFVVITKGSGRISEVSARFVLDAMPGKQMAIDADLNAGLIESDEARKRRASIASEAEFYGAMDGASKFVRGDAIAGVIITSLNLLGGVAIGLLGGMTFAQAGERFSKMTVGDGLVSQIPALFVSTAAAVLVTKASSTETLGTNLLSQVSSRPKATLIASGMLFALGLLPGMPGAPFYILATIMLVVWRSTRHADGAESFLPVEATLSEAPAQASEEDKEQTEAEKVADLLRVDRISLEIGYRLIPLVQEKDGTGALDHIAQLRRRFAINEGVVLPPVRIKDNVHLEPSAYRILVGGLEIGRGAVEPDKFLAMDGGGASGKVNGEETVDPAFGLPAWWISEADRDEAEILGYTVVDPTSALVTHLSEILRGSLAEIFNRDDVKDLVDNVRKITPAVVDEIIPDKISYGQVQQVLRNLMRENVSIRNMPAILESIADNYEKTRDPEALCELVRQRLARVLCERHIDTQGVLHAVTLDPDIEASLAAAIGSTSDPDAGNVSPAYLQQLVERIADVLGKAARGGSDAVLLVRSSVRRFIGELVRSSLPKATVLSYNEVVPARSVETAGIVTLED